MLTFPLLRYRGNQGAEKVFSGFFFPEASRARRTSRSRNKEGDTVYTNSEKRIGCQWKDEARKPQGPAPETMRTRRSEQDRYGAQAQQQDPQENSRSHGFSLP